MKKYILEVFDSRNTAERRVLNERDGFSARNQARALSIENEYPVVLRATDERGNEYGQPFIEYERGQCMSRTIEPVQ